MANFEMSSHGQHFFWLYGFVAFRHYSLSINCVMNMHRVLVGLLALVFYGATIVKAQQEVGHFAPGVLGIRDYEMPAPGWYVALYSYKYSTTQLNDAEGNEINSITINPGSGPGATIDLNVDVNVGVIAPTIIWVSKWKLFGASYGAYLSPSFSNTSVGASLSIYTGSGRSANESQFGFGDLFVQPLWLGWNKEHLDVAFGYGFYAPVGKYNTETLTLPGAGGSITAEDADNIGYGFWTHQLQVATAWYPWTDRRMAIAPALTYEAHSNKRNYDLKPGQNLSFSWGISQYLPLKRDQTLLLEVGPAGYDSWQITDDTGADAVNPPTKDGVHAVGGQLGLTQVKWNAALNFHYFYEFAAKDRFRGSSVGLNFALNIPHKEDKK